MNTAQLPIITLEVMRYRPEVDVEPWKQSFQIPWFEDMSILDALNYAKDNFEPELAYRWSCRMAVCGSCGVVVNGEPKLACSTFVREYAGKVDKITVGALDNFVIEKDLVVDIDPFIKKLESIKPYIIEKQNEHIEKEAQKQAEVAKEEALKLEPSEAVVNAQTMPACSDEAANNKLAREHIQLPAQLAKFKNYTMCINCMLCYQACPQFALNPDFLGPAAIALATRYNLDTRDHGSNQRDSVLYTENGAWPCTFVGYCSVVCPKHVDPAASIQQTKSKGLMYFAGELLGKGE